MMLPSYPSDGMVYHLPISEKDPLLMYSANKFKKSAAPMRLLVIATGNGQKSSSFIMTLPPSVTVEEVLTDISSICENEVSPSTGWDWLYTPLIERGYQIDATGFLLRAQRFSAVAELEVDFERDAYGLECWSKTQEMYEGIDRGDITYAPEAIGREFLLTKINWSHLPEDEDEDEDDDSHDYPDSADFTAELVRLRFAFEEKRDEMPAGQRMILAALLDECDRAIEDYRRYEHLMPFSEPIIEEKRDECIIALKKFERILASDPDEVLGDMDDPKPAFAPFRAPAPSAPTVDMDKLEDVLDKATGAAEDMRFISEYASCKYGDSPFEREDAV